MNLVVRHGDTLLNG